MKKLLLCGIFSLLLFNLKAQPGTLDPAFGTSGKLTTPLSVNDYGSFYAITQQSDGKLVATGAGYNKNTALFNIRVMRYDKSGTIDNTFGNNGIVTLNTGSGDYERATAVAIQPDGKILVAGFTFFINNLDMFVLRLKSNGTLDSTFGLNGISVKDLNGEEYGNCMSLLPNGKILIGGCVNTGTDLDFAVLRFNNLGILDTTFGNKGKVVFPVENGSDDVVLSMAVASGGKIILGGYSYNNINSTSKIALARVDSSGNLDNTFGTSGKVLNSYNAGGDGLNSIALQADGKIIGVGNSNRATLDILVTRYTTSGVPDNTFGTNGLVYCQFGQKHEEGNAVAIQADGKILVAGNTDSAGGDFALIRLHPTGVYDSTFGTFGKVATDFSAAEDIPNAILIQTDGRVVLAGYAKNDCALARYMTAPPVVDAAISLLTVPASKCGSLGINQSVTVRLTNNGTLGIGIGAPVLQLKVSGANTGNYNASTTSILNAGTYTTITFNTVNLSNIGINVFDVSVQLTGDIDSTNNKLSTSDTAFNVKPTAAFTMTNSGNTYNFTPAVIGKNPITYKWNFGDGSPVSNLPNPSHHYSYVSAYYAKLVVTDACGGSDSISKIVNITIGINHPKTGDYFQIYPNPAINSVTIITLNPAKASVLYFTDITGNILLEVTPDSNGQYDLKVADYANGMYLLRIDNQIQKLLINH